MSTDREQIINFLLQSGDNKDRVIATLQEKLALLEKQLADAPTTELKKNKKIKTEQVTA